MDQKRIKYENLVRNNFDVDVTTCSIYLYVHIQIEIFLASNQETSAKFNEHILVGFLYPAKVSIVTRESGTIHTNKIVTLRNEY